MSTHTVQQGECLSIIAARYKLRWRKVWEFSENADLRKLRKSPNVLHPGDVVHIPEPEQKNEPAPTGKLSRFVIARDLVKLHLRIVSNEEPVADTAYTLELEGGEKKKGTTDGDGKLEVELPRSAKFARLELAGRTDEYIVRLGRVDPADELTGVQARLHNLGFYQGAIDGRLGPRTRAGLRDFQEAHKLKVTGEADGATRDKLVALYGC